MTLDLDLTDRKLIYLLDFHARISLTQIGKKLHISKQVAKYRIEQLQKKGIMQGFYTDISASKIGYTIFLVYLKFHHMSSEQENEFIKHVSKSSSVGVNTSINGTWNYCIGIWAINVVHFKRIYQKIMKDYEQIVKEKTIMIETDFHYFKPKQFAETESEEQITMTGDIGEFKIDNEDKIILKNLAKNARESLVDISEQTKLSAVGVKHRIKKLELNKIILGYRVMINYQQLGFTHYRVFLHLQTMSEEKEKQMIYYLKFDKRVISVTKTIGFCDLEFRAVVKSVDDFYEMMNKLRDNFPEQIKNFDNIVYYRFHDTLNYFPVEDK
jgi:DNA-binding Lrp family transcriptional regulator